jgi:glycosyltransferase involved in cell wall biosynthesis
MKILVLIRALTIGGAERQVALLARGLRRAGHTVKVAVFYGGGELEADLATADVPIINLEKRGRWDTLGFLGRLIRSIRAERPEVIYSFLPVANILTVPLAPLLPRAKRVWALRASNMDGSRYDRLVRLAYRLEIALAGTAHGLIANSHAGRRHAIEQGMPEARIEVVPNGFELDRFHPDPPAGRRVRAEWGCADARPLIGLVGRLDPMKGHACFLKAAARFGRTCPEARFVCVGDGPADYRRSLAERAAQLDLNGRLLWAGARTDMPAVYNALDIAVSSSGYGEGLSNMLGEAMACGVPCVATDVGDSALVVGDTGVVVPPEDPERLAAGLSDLWRRIEAGQVDRPALRARVERLFSLPALVDATVAAFGRL